jgi:hypothetical protein
MVKDAYNGLKRLITDRYKRGAGIAALEEDPSSEVQRKALEETLRKSDLSKDPEALQKAKGLSEALAQAPREALETIGVHIGELEAINARFGELEVSGPGRALDIDKAKLLVILG